MTRITLAVLAVAAVLYTLARGLGRTPRASAPTPDEWDGFAPMAAWIATHGPELFVLPRGAYVTRPEWRN